MADNEMTISEYDVLVFKDQQTERARKHERSINRWQQGSLAVGWIALAFAVIAVAYIIWQATAGPSAADQLVDRQKRECIANEGTWVRIASGSADSEATCIFGRTQP